MTARLSVRLTGPLGRRGPCGDSINAHLVKPIGSSCRRRWTSGAFTTAPRRRPLSSSLRSRPAVDAMAASGVEDERVSGEVRGEEDDDDMPQLSAAAMVALREFLAEQQRPDEQSETGGGEGGVELVPEDWRLSQFWYDERTARALVEEVIRLVSTSGSGSAASAVVCIACPTLYAYLKKTDPGVPAQLLEYDERFGQYGGDFTFYDYNRPEELPPAMKHAYRVVVADPPYLSKECLEKVAKTMSFLAQPEGSFLLLLTGEVQKDRALELLNVRPCGFRPRHSNKLGNEFRLFTNYDPTDRLGGWDESDSAPSIYCTLFQSCSNFVNTLSLFGNSSTDRSNLNCSDSYLINLCGVMCGQSNIYTVSVPHFPRDHVYGGCWFCADEQSEMCFSLASAESF